MAKRGKIIDNMRISKAGETKAPRAPGVMKTTAINIPVDTWTMLRTVAFARAQVTGERPSVSAIRTGRISVDVSYELSFTTHWRHREISAATAGHSSR